MPTLKRKTSSGWTTVAPPYPAQITKHVTQIAPHFTELNATANGEYTPQAPYNGFTAATVNVTTGGVPSVIRAGDTPVLYTNTVYQAQSTSLAESTVKLTIPRDGTYRIKWGVGEGDGSGYSVQSTLYRKRNGQSTAVGSSHTTTGNNVYTEDLPLEEGDEVIAWVKGYNYSGMHGCVSGMSACIDWDIWGD